MLVLAMLAFGLAVFFVSEVATAPNRRRHEALKRAAVYGLAPRNLQVDVPQFTERVLAPAIARFAALALRLSPRASVEATAARLRAAGLSGRIGATTFLAVKAALALAGAGVAVLLAVATTPVVAILFGPLLAALGFLGPDTILTNRVRDRRDRIRGELPDALDLLAVSVEAGLGFDGAITKLTEHMKGALVDEFALTLGEMRIGESRHDALRKLAERVDVTELGSFVRSVVQADQLGISLGRILRVQAADSRLRRQAAAEEKAMKAPIKMLFPTAIFIFPAMFVVILGPAMLTLTHALKFK
ncbi:MAG TPA: type II secretion system F family protein [Gaiellaceae bacterium]|nr:type II secretion system F family protein [Gaiellaceae bacterium]